ncbi:transcriptional regulator, TetR family [Agreia bicolorata]|uniref:Transcriptional regulator, TetR family n=1 Tax=Agreia bicolorata TaxID=110935 RepID=A0A1T4WRM2_9MICO|nr:transcriptional regulator, TetR family [Agreia bicolorata]
MTSDSRVPQTMRGDGRHPRIGASCAYRVVPVQRRGRETVAGILAAAREISRTVYAGDLLMKDVAEQSGLADGTVYRYFRNDDALRSALAAQALELYCDAMTALIAQGTCARWQDVVLLHITLRVDSYCRGEGPAAIPDRLRAEANESQVIAEFLGGVIRARDVDLQVPADLDHRIELSVRISDALVIHAFSTRPSQRRIVLAECRSVVEQILAR